jgi:hypothetical protein
MFVILLFCLLPSTIFATVLQDLVLASNDFEIEMIEHEHVLEQDPSATELAASILKYAKAKERYYVTLRKSVPTLIDMATGKTPKTPEVDKISEIFSGDGETQERRLEAATVSIEESGRDCRTFRCGSLDCFPDDERGSGERVTESSALNAPFPTGYLLDFASRFVAFTFAQTVPDRSRFALPSLLGFPKKCESLADSGRSFQLSNLMAL